MPKQHVTIPVFIPHMGCTHRCVFCNQHGSTPARCAVRPEEIDELVCRYTSSVSSSVTRIEIAFFGGSFTAITCEIQERYLAVAHRNLRDGNVDGIRVSTRPDCLSNGALDLLAKYGVTVVEIGAQSFNDQVLAASGRGHSARDSIDAVERTRARGFETVIQLMPGLPLDTHASSLESARIACDCAPSAVRIYPAVVLRNTGLELLHRSGAYDPLPLDAAVTICAAMYRVCASNGVPVIRMGLHPLPPEDVANIVAGPYHPAFGYLVKSRLRRDEITSLVEEHIRLCGTDIDRLSLTFPERFAGEYIGPKGENLAHLKKAFNFSSLRYSAAQCAAPSISSHHKNERGHHVHEINLRRDVSVRGALRPPGRVSS